MDVGGAGYNQEAARAVRITSVVVTPVLALYSLLVMAGVVPSSHYVNAPITLAVSITWVLMSILYYFKPVNNLGDQAIRIGLIHFFALLTLMFITGFTQPFAPLFILLFLGSYLYFGRPGLVLSAGSLFAAAIIDVIIRYPINSNVLIENGISVFSIIFLGFAVVGVISAQETKRQALVHSQRRERLQYDRILTIMNNLSDAAFTTDEKGSILSVS